MKQHISIEQLNELSEKGKEKLREWYHSKGGIVGYNVYRNGLLRKQLKPSEMGIASENISIGQMIEFLDEHSKSDFIYITTAPYAGDKKWKAGLAKPTDMVSEPSIKQNDNLADSLWEAVKEVLNEETKP